MKAQFLKISGHKNEKDFYKEFPNIETFMAKHGTALKKAQNGLQTDANRNGIPDYLESVDPSQMAQQYQQLFPAGKMPAQMGPQMGVSQNSKLSSVSNFANLNGGQGQGFGSAMKGMFSGGDAGNGGLGKAFGDIGKSFGIGGGSGGGGGISSMMGGGGGGMSNAGGYIQAIGSVVEGVSAIKGEKALKRKAKSDAAVVQIVRDAYDSKDVNRRDDYMNSASKVRKALVPTVNADALFPTYGTGTNPLGQAAHGGEITNTYAPGTLYDDLEYEPASVFQPLENINEVKSYQYGGNMNSYNNTMNSLSQNNQMMALGNTYSSSTNIGKFDNAGGKIGSGIGQAVGTYFGGPLGGMVGKFAGKYIGGALDTNYKKIAGYNYQKEEDLKYMSGSTGLQNIRSGSFGSYTKNGGKMRTGGNLRKNSVGDIQALSGGHLEPVSYNPYSDGTGVTSMIKGQTHDESNGKHTGVLLSYNRADDGSSLQADVEAENNEPITEIGDNAVIFGDMKINKLTVGNDPMFKNMQGKTFKKAMEGIAEQNKKLNKQQAKNTQALNSLDPKTPFDKLKMNSLMLNAKAIDTKYAINDAAMKKAAAYQEVVNEEASRLDINSGDFSRGKLSPSDDGRAKSGKTTPRKKLEPVNQLTPVGATYSDEPKADFIKPGIVPVSQPDPNYGVTPYKVGPEAIIGQILPWFRDQPGENLNNDQIAGELNALSDNDVDPVQARFYHPNLRSPYDVSYQDQLNENQASFNQLVSASSNNPAVLAALAAQKYSANSKVLADQFRANQAMKEGVYSQNTATLNDALMKNLQIADQQYVRQAQAKSATKAVRQEALSSIASKVAQNRLENRTLQAYANLFPDYSFDSNYRIRKTGAPTAFNIDQSIYTPTGDVNKLPVYNNDGEIVGYQSIDTTKKATKESRNGSIVKAFRDL